MRTLRIAPRNKYQTHIRRESQSQHLFIRRQFGISAPLKILIRCFSEFYFKQFSRETLKRSMKKLDSYLANQADINGVGQVL